MRPFSCGVFSMLMSLCGRVSSLPERHNALSPGNDGSRLDQAGAFGAGHLQFFQFLQAMNNCSLMKYQPSLDSKPFPTCTETSTFPSSYESFGLNAFLLPFLYALDQCLSCLAPGAFSSQSWFLWKGKNLAQLPSHAEAEILRGKLQTS